MDKNRLVVIADAGPIIHLDELGCLDVLADWEKVYVPNAVWQEVVNHQPRAMDVFSSLFIRQNTVKTSPLVTALTPLYTLHSGEQEALHWCVAMGNSLLLTDDTAAPCYSTLQINRLMITGYVPWSIFNAHVWSKFNKQRH
ncbi:hypothetical protein [Candidatus Symbiobacter mobilis]|uniref:Nucleic acid-binding protein n=1 Tax=Candidatus Symbiobacter mobilis CR TaxID=946483 RepID=U5NC35_9BURK|nr:hypothetical protein [Candidatus Symbiobacter mobilis]AGX87749.1 hypothetical protein Cenrod_1664 [Candidatus Symbiobacter mobilis CR]